VSHVNAVAFTILVVSFLSVTLIGVRGGQMAPGGGPEHCTADPGGAPPGQAAGFPAPAATAVPAPTASAAGARDRPRPRRPRARAPE